MATLRQVVRQLGKQKTKVKGSATTSATATTTTVITLKPKVKAKLMTELRAYADVHGEIKTLKVSEDKHKAEIRKIRESLGESSLELEGFKTRDVPGEQTYFDKDEFVERGGNLKLYNDCLKKKPKKAYEKISVPGEKETTDAE